MSILKTKAKRRPKNPDHAEFSAFESVYAQHGEMPPVDMRPHGERNDTIQSTVGIGGRNRDGDWITTMRHAVETGDLDRHDRAVLGEHTLGGFQAIRNIQARHSDLAEDGLVGVKTHARQLPEVNAVRAIRATGLDPASPHAPPNPLQKAAAKLKPPAPAIEAEAPVNLLQQAVVSKPLAQTASPDDAPPAVPDLAQESLKGGEGVDALEGDSGRANVVDGVGSADAPPTTFLTKVSTAAKQSVLAFDDLPEDVVQHAYAEIKTSADALQYASAIRHIFGRSTQAAELSNLGHFKAKMIKAGRKPAQLSHSVLDEAARTVRQNRTLSADIRTKSGLGVSTAPDQRSNDAATLELTDLHGRPILEMEKLRLRRDIAAPAFDKAWTALGAASNGLPEAERMSMAAAAIAEGDRQIMWAEGFLFKSVEDRLAAYKGAARILSDPSRTLAERKAAGAIAYRALMPASEPEAKIARFTASLAPLLGSAIAAESAYGSSKAAVEAVDRGDYGAAALNAGAAALEALSIAVTPVKVGGSLASKSNREVLKAGATVYANRAFDAGLGLISRKEAARHRVQWMMRREKRPQLIEIAEEKAELLSKLPQSIRGRVNGAISDAVGNAGQKTLDQILERIERQLNH